MKIEINGNIEDISAMLYGNRQVMKRDKGRKEMKIEINGNIEDISAMLYGNRQVMIRDIEQCSNYGWYCDENEWKKLLSKLKEVKK